MTYININICRIRSYFGSCSLIDHIDLWPPFIDGLVPYSCLIALLWVFFFDRDTSTIRMAICQNGFELFATPICFLASG